MRKRQILVLSGFFIIFFFLISISSALAGEYEVKKGDSLYSISRKLGVSIKAIQDANHLHGTALKPYQFLNIPQSSNSASKSIKKAQSVGYYRVKAGDNLGTIARKTGVPVRDLMEINNVRPKSLRIGQRLALAKEPEEEIIDEDNSLLDEDEDIDEEDEITKAELEKKRYADLLGKWNNTDERKLFIKVATGYLGAPYRLGGSTVRGIDCSAYVRKMYQLFDVTLPRTAREQSHVGVTIGREELVEGDLVFFRTRRPVGHVGIYIGNNEFVHASSKERAVRIDSLETPYFNRRFVRAVRVKGIDSIKAANDHGA
jgi:LysM repeat protein